MEAVVFGKGYPNTLMLIYLDNISKAFETQTDANGDYKFVIRGLSTGEHKIYDVNIIEGKTSPKSDLINFQIEGKKEIKIISVVEQLPETGENITNTILFPIDSTAVEKAVLGTSIGLDIILLSLIILVLRLIFVTRIKNPWGIVYDKLETHTIPFVTLDIIDKATGNIIESTITDIKGRFKFNTLSGNMTITSKIEHFRMLLKNDLIRLNDEYYQGQVLSRTAQINSMKIPMISIKIKGFWKNLKKIGIELLTLVANNVNRIVRIAFILNFILLLLNPSLINLFITFLYMIAMLLLFYMERVGEQKKIKIVDDDGSAVRSGFVKAFSLTDTGCVETWITNSKGEINIIDYKDFEFVINIPDRIIDFNFSMGINKGKRDVSFYIPNDESVKIVLKKS